MGGGGGGGGHKAMYLCMNVNIDCLVVLKGWGKILSRGQPPPPKQSPKQYHGTRTLHFGSVITEARACQICK